MRLEKPGYYNIFIGLALIFAVAGNGYLINNNVKIVLLSVFAPMIFFGAGTLYKNAEKEFSDSTIGKLFREIMIPYIWFSLFYILIDSVKIVVLKSYDLSIIRQELLDTLTLYGSSVLWYLPVLFLASVIYGFTRNHLKWPVVIILVAIMSIACVILFSNIDVLINEADSLVKAVGFRFFACIWRTIIAILFMAIGEAAETIVSNMYRKKLVLAFVSIISTVCGVILIKINGLSDIRNLDFGKAQFFFSGITLFAIGVYGISKWISQAGIFEFIGVNARIVYLTFINFGAVSLADILSQRAFEIFENYFITKLIYLISLVVIELVYIILINRFLFFTVSKEQNRTFGLITRIEND